MNEIFNHINISSIVFLANAQIVNEKGFIIKYDTAETVIEQLICAHWTADSLHSKVLTLTNKIAETSKVDSFEGHQLYLEQIGELYGPSENKEQLINARKPIDLSERRIIELKLMMGDL